ncbi:MULTISPECIES: hypothetical protein [unclassified Serratia (in: enterobacteria)]|uniref:hypothetical protein n=1 Tax=unclassified Serratia (in: enterobacteria) TaxID=2647522 RepID=UPI000502C7C5|nr:MULTISPECIES: hypothetical protein [unclassified Serratia (in: enterobacteria)]KFK96383.1 hypothetical protein JV45_04745 [Serratia sp. Ag2]KFK99858.1 hypothetical protein IV04_04625 [Serratia sp. Ag1]
MKNKKWLYSLGAAILLALLILAYFTVMRAQDRFFKCDTEIHFENSKSNSLIDANTSLLLTSNSMAILDVNGVITKDGVDFNVNRKVYFIYNRESHGDYYYFKRVKEEDYATTNSASSELFNDIMFGNKKDFYMSITSLGNGGYELSEMIFPVVVCYSKRI